MENTNDTSQAIEIYRMNPRRGFDLLYAALADRLATYLRRAFCLGSEEIADVIHDCFLPWVERPEKMKTIVNPRAYVFSTAKYLAIKRRRAQVHSEWKADIPVESTVGGTGQLETALDIETALQKLPPEQQEVVALKIWGDLTLEEIASVQEVSLNTAASRYRYALQKLKEILT
jgi:RNA polymerase sigma-70 factor (ECF subfamily)